MPGTISFIKQSFPGTPQFTEKDVPDLSRKVAIVTGANTGLGKEIAQILYSKNAKVYIMARSEKKSRKAIESIQTANPHSTGELHYIPLDLADLTTIKRSANTFLTRESHLHLLFNNAGVGYPEKGSLTPQGYELQLGVNCIGTFTLTTLLTPTLLTTASHPSTPPGSVRTIWVSSSAAEAITPSKSLIPDLSNTMAFLEKPALEQYSTTKLGTYLYATEFAARHRAAGIVSVPINPGNLDSEFWRTQGKVTACVLRKTLLHPPVKGAYTALFAAVAEEVREVGEGLFVAPWGRVWKVSDEMIAAGKGEKAGGTGVARELWEWTEDQVMPYL